MAFHLDHIVILVPYATLNSPPEWITSNFTVIPGGAHADGTTENKLICFRDGSYVELIAFVNDDPKLRAGHWWGEKKFGIIDFALTTRNGDASASLSQVEERLSRLDSGGAPKVEYQRPVRGARKRPDGQVISWEVTFPVVTTGYQRGELPFFCHDLTPRPLRVSFAEEIVTHPNGSHGVDELYIYVAQDKLSAVADAFAAILGVPNTVSDEDPNFVGSFELKRFNEIPGTEDTVLVIGLPYEEEQLAAMEERNGLLLGGLTLGGKGLLKRIDVEDGGLGGITAPVFTA